MNAAIAPLAPLAPPVAESAAESDANALWDHDPHAERALLGAVLLDFGDREEVWARASSALTVDSFGERRHKLIFAAMARLRDRGDGLDVATVAGELRDHNVIHAVSEGRGGVEYLDSLFQHIRDLEQVDTYLRRILERQARRQVAGYARALLAKAQSPREALAPLLAGALAALESVALPGVEAPTLDEDVDDYFAILEGKAPASTPPVPTGLAELDEALHGGLRMGSYFLLGLSGTGKTTMAAQWAAHIAATTGWVLFISKEENRDKLRDALLAHLGRVPYASVVRAREFPENPNLSADEMQRITDGANRLVGMRLRVLDPSRPGCPNTVTEVVAVARAMSPRPVAVFIDNLGELTARGSYGARTDLATEEKAKDLRRAKNLLKIPFITLAHPTGTPRSGAKPRRVTEADIAGGQPAVRITDGVIVMHCEDKHPTRGKGEESPAPGVVELYSGKVRGLSRPLYCEALAIVHEHRFASTRLRDGDPFAPAYAPPVAAGADSLDAYGAGDGLPDVDVPAVQLGFDDLGPQDEAVAS